MLNYYDHEQLAQNHYQDLLHEAEHERQLLQVSRAKTRMLFFAPLTFSLHPLRIKARKETTSCAAPSGAAFRGR